MDALWTLAVWTVGAVGALWTLAGVGLLVESVFSRDRRSRRQGALYLVAGLGLLPFALIGLADGVALLVLPGLALSALATWLLARHDRRHSRPGGRLPQQRPAGGGTVV
jgi:hypothetical protein